MSVHKDGDGWRVRWREGSRNRSRKFDRKADALLFDAEVRRERQLGAFIPQRTGGITLEDFIVQWLSDKKPNLAPATLELYGRMIDTHIQPHIGHIPVNELRLNTLEDWQRERQAKGVGPEALSKAIALLRQILRRAVRAKLLPENLAADLEPPISKSRIPTPADPEQIEALRDWFLGKERPADATLVSVLGYAGLRPGEALGLRWADVEKTSISITCSISMGQEKKTKTGALRVVRPPRQVFLDLATWKLASPAPFGLIWPRRKDGEPWNRSDWRNWRQRYFAKAVEAVGLGDFRPYDLRHSRASMLAAEGTSILQIQVAAREMGHSTQMFLSTYAHILEQARDRENVSAEQWIAEARSKRREATG